MGTNDDRDNHGLPNVSHEHLEIPAFGKLAVETPANS